MYLRILSHIHSRAPRPEPEETAVGIDSRIPVPVLADFRLLRLYRDFEKQTMTTGEGAIPLNLQSPWLKSIILEE